MVGIRGGSYGGQKKDCYLSLPPCGGGPYKRIVINLTVTPEGVPLFLTGIFFGEKDKNFDFAVEKGTWTCKIGLCSAKNCRGWFSKPQRDRSGRSVKAITVGSVRQSGQNVGGK
jgi:hypothetical protein